MCNWMQKQVEGIDVFAVGKRQLWDWCGWSSRGLECGVYAMYCYADSLRKGVYVVVESHARLGQVSKCIVAASFGSLRAAANYVNCCIDSDVRMFAELRKGWLYAHDYEIWHVVDDGELWDYWNDRAAYALYMADLAESLRQRLDASNWEPGSGLHYHYAVRHENSDEDSVRSDIGAVDLYRFYFASERDAFVADLNEVVAAWGGDPCFECVSLDRARQLFPDAFRLRDDWDGWRVHDSRDWRAAPSSVTWQGLWTHDFAAYDALNEPMPF